LTSPLAALAKGARTSYCWPAVGSFSFLPDPACLARQGLQSTRSTGQESRSLAREGFGLCAVYSGSRHFPPNMTDRQKAAWDVSMRGVLGAGPAALTDCLPDYANHSASRITPELLSRPQLRILQQKVPWKVKFAGDPDTARNTAFW
jgi:hypothetical protein